MGNAPASKKGDTTENGEHFYPSDNIAESCFLMFRSGGNELRTYYSFVVYSPIESRSTIYNIAAEGDQRYTHILATFGIE
ncbi:hypothetical protein BLOT_001183 [Blomia tropicalis]|nr:hypothetical protein BLOT_001183 [Blomia tropicalis]